MSEINLIVGCEKNKVVINKRGAGLSSSLRVDDSGCSLSSCDRRLYETGSFASFFPLQHQSSN